MMKKEVDKDLKHTLASEGFTHIYEWTDKPDTEYAEHSHEGKVTFYILKGNIRMTIAGISKEVQTGERCDVPIGAPHTAKVGPEGCTFLVGEEIEGDS